MNPDDVRAAVQQLSAARTPAELLEAHKVARRAVLRSRRAANAFGPLAQTYVAAMEIWDAEKADGVALEERVAHLEKTLRASWPQGREWQYLCEACRDTGLELFQCDGGSLCGRSNPHAPHEFGRPCHCAKGGRFRPKPKPTKDDFQAAGKMTKAGRR